MNCLSKTSYLLVLAVISVAPAQGQFPWSAPNDTPAAIQKTGSITWKTDLPEALKLAREQHKLVFLHFSGTHCPPCRKLEANVLSRNDVAITMLSRYVPVFIIVEEAPELVDRFNIKGWPTDVIVDSEGREIVRHISPQDHREFIKRISTIAAKHHAGQSATIANVRAAVAADVIEEEPSVQQTAADDRVPQTRQSPRAESKVVRNPHTRDSQAAPIVTARNPRSKKSVAQEDASESEGFSPPNSRRLPPIVRKSRKVEEEEVATSKSPQTHAASPDEPLESETAVAPWRKGWKPERNPPAEVAVAPDDENVKQDKKVADEPKHVLTDEAPHGDEPPVTDLPSQPKETESDKEAVEAPESEAKSESEAHSAPESTSDAPPVAEEAHSKKSRFAVPEQTEAEADTKNTKVDEPAAEAEAKAVPDSQEAPSEPPAEAQPEPKADPAQEEHPAPVKKEVAGERKPSKSRFAEADTEAPAAEETEVETKKESQPEPEASDADDKKPVTVPSEEPPTETKSKSVASEKHDADEANDLATKVEEPLAEEVAPELKAKEETSAAPEVEAKQAEPVAEPAPPKKEVSKKPSAKKPVVAAKEEQHSEEPRVEQPRGIAKLTKTGKYVLGGHCCVALMETEQLKKGNPKIGAVHRGRIYLFSSEEARAKFLQNPDDYSPMLTGYDPVIFSERGELVEGSPNILAKLQGGRIITFANEESFDKFAAEYQQKREKSVYVEATRAAMKETNGGRHLR